MTAAAASRVVLVAAVAVVLVLVAGRALRTPTRIVVDGPTLPPREVADDGATRDAVATRSVPAAPRPAATTQDDEGRPVPAGAADGEGATRAVAGVVVDRVGRPVAGALVRRPGVRGGRNARTTTDDAGRFVLAGLPAGPLPLEVQVPDVAALERGPALGVTTFEARAGATDLRVVVDVGAEVVLRWADPSPAPATVDVWVRREGGPPARTVRLDGAGRGSLRGLRETDRLIVWVPADADDRVVLVREAPPTGELALRREPAGRIVVRLRGLASGPPPTVFAEESDCFVRIVGSAQADGAHVIRGVPSGTRWRVTATLDTSDDGDAGRSVSVDDARPGATVELDLRSAD